MKRISYYLNLIARNTDTFYQLSDNEFDQLRKLFIEMYFDIKKVCDKYGLTVMLGFGSALGARRHNGFIPWDDDFDMIMPREDVEIFRSFFEQELSDKYILSSPRTSQEAKTLYMQVIKKNTTMLDADDLNRLDACGIRVDIYPIEHLPDSFLWREIKIKLVDILRVIAISTSIFHTKNKLFQRVMRFNRETKLYYTIRYIIGMVFSVFGKTNLYNLYDKFASCSKGKKFLYVPTAYMGKKSMLLAEDYLPAGSELFEGVSMPVPHNNDVYLKRLYHDYMQLPPIEGRERHFYVRVDFHKAPNDIE